MQKALTFMNIQLHHVIATITGVTGMRIIRAIVAGERDPDKLAAMRDIRCKESIETISGALVGNYQPEHVFALKQSLALYDFYQQCIDECDVEIERATAGLNTERPMPAAPLPKAKHRSKMPSDPNFNVHLAMYQLAGTDLTQIHGVGPFLALRLIVECGTDLSRWRTAKHFTSWLTLSPGCKISGGKVPVGTHPQNEQQTHRRTQTRGGDSRKKQHRTRRILPPPRGPDRQRQGGHGDCAQDRRAVLQRLRHGMDYHDPGADHYEQQYRERVIKQLHRRAAQFGYSMQPKDAPA